MKILVALLSPYQTALTHIHKDAEKQNVKKKWEKLPLSRSTENLMGSILCIHPPSKFGRNPFSSFLVVFPQAVICSDIFSCFLGYVGQVNVEFWFWFCLCFISVKNSASLSFHMLQCSMTPGCLAYLPSSFSPCSLLSPISLFVSSFSLFFPSLSLSSV